MLSKKTFATISRRDFNRLSPQSKRVIIARDVISQLDARKFKPNRGDYLQFDMTDHDLDKIGMRDESIDPHILLPRAGRVRPWRIANVLPQSSAKNVIQAASACHVCAKGSIVCSYIGKFNGVTMRQLDNNTSSLQEVVDIFGHDLWSELEAQFEGCEIFRARNVSAALWRACKVIVIKKAVPLRKLMENIIENKGRLKVHGILIG